MSPFFKNPQNKQIHIEAYPDSDELRDSIIWCIKHKHDLRKWGENGRKMFLDDKNYFEDKMEKFIGSKV